MPLNPQIIQALLSTPPRPHISIHPSDVGVEQFPDHIFPQLHSIKKHNRRARRAKEEEMNSVNWTTGIRVNRPFEDPAVPFACGHYAPPRPLHPFTIPRFPTPQPCSPPPSPRTPSHLSLPRMPPILFPLSQSPRTPGVTKYYLEQAAFYHYDESAIGPDPFATEPAEPIPGPLQVFVLAAFAMIANLIANYDLDPLLATGHAIVLWCLGTMQNVWYWAGRVKSGVCVAVLVAIPIALCVPLPERRAGPVYTIRVADGNGHVMPGAY